MRSLRSYGEGIASWHSKQGEQIVETLVLHEKLHRKAAKARAIQMLHFPEAPEDIEKARRRLAQTNRQRY